MNFDIPSDHARGKQQSEADIEAGRPRLYWQTRGSWGELLTSLMVDRFGVAVEHISDMTTPEQSSYRKGYNQATVDYIDTKFGPGSFQSVIEDVRRYRQEQAKRYFDSGSEE